MKVMIVPTFDAGGAVAAEKAKELISACLDQLAAKMNVQAVGLLKLEFTPYDEAREPQAGHRGLTVEWQPDQPLVIHGQPDDSKIMESWVGEQS